MVAETEEGVLPITDSPSPQKAEEEHRPPQKYLQRSLHYFQRDVSIDYADIPIIACSLVSGLCDSSAYNAWTCFVSMQTGNTIFLALGASGQPVTHPFGWVKSLTSITCFLVGCFCFASTRHFHPLYRGTLALSFFVQGVLIFVSAALVEAGIAPEPLGVATESGVNFIELLPLAFLAFQSGGQIVTSRLLGFNEVPTTVLTSVYCDLVSDPNLLAPLKKNVKRNRRFAAVVTFLIGGISGGWLSRSSARLSSSLWIGGSIKIAIAVSWSLWRDAKK